MGYTTRAILKIPKPVPGMGEVLGATASPAIRRAVRPRVNYRLTGLGRAAVRRGGPRMVIRRGLRGLGDCVIIDSATGGRVTYPSGDPHCGPTPPTGGGGTSGCGLK